MISKLRRNLRERGIRGTVGRAFARVREGYTVEELIVQLKTTDSIVEPPKPSGLRVEEMTPGHLPELIELNRKRSEPASADRYFETSFELGYNGFVARVGGELVGYYWWVDRDSPHRHPELWRLGRGFELAPGDVYGSSLFLAEQHRGGGAAGDLLFAVETSFRERGYKRIWGFLDKGNRPARWLYEVRGYEQVWPVVIRRLAFLRWRKGGPPR